MKVHYIPVFLGLIVTVFYLGSSRLSGEEGNAAPGGEQAPKVAEPEDLDQAKRMTVQTYARIAEATYMSALVSAIELRKKIKILVTEPTADNHVAAKLSWIQARLPYLQTEPLFSYGRQAAEMDSWPIRPGYIDYVDGNPESGIICVSASAACVSPSGSALLSVELRITDSGVGPRGSGLQTPD